VHRGRAVCSAAGEFMFVRPVAMVEPIDHERIASAFLMANDNRDRAASLAEIPQLKIDSPAPTRGMLFRAA
jgi:hypothetical protein